MKTYILIPVLVIFCLTKVAAQSQKDSIEATIVHFFDGFSALNTDKLKAYSTDDFLLLENGEVWNMDTVVNKLSKPGNANIQRINSFAFIKTERKGNTAWVSYHNTALFKSGDKQQTVKWLESAVLVKQNGRWRIQLMHSTRLK